MPPLLYLIVVFGSLASVIKVRLCLTLDVQLCCLFRVSVMI